MGMKVWLVWLTSAAIAAIGVSVGAAFHIQSQEPPTKLIHQAQPAKPAAKPKLDRVIRYLESQSRLITAKVLVGKTWGSGIFVQRQGQVYSVLTNRHVLEAGEPYQIQTPDGRIYPALPLRPDNFQANDLAILQFNSDQSYTTAQFGQSSVLRAGSLVFAAGFPNQPRKSEQEGFQFLRGQVSLLMSKAFEGGYQVGYTNQIVKGMSGGPLLNSQGEVVAINGMHAYPLWGDPYVFADGSRPPVNLKDRLYQISWGIPVETVLRLAPRSLQLATRASRF